MDVQQVETGNEGIENGWSLEEQAIARKVFDLAYEREIAGLMRWVNEQAGSITQVDDMWRLHDFLSAKRHDLDGKYDFRYPFLIMVFAQLVKEGWLKIPELEGLDPSKRAKISALSKM
jgi:Photoprotection regulator fluorescence recovery protein